ncbi:hypothetical protein ACF09J_07645 [Streptomyces sp. NPDC014889]|uniref:hypothetical protein n=1 Tax=Streptomyces sp. NPDC014889 TaxID=3364928 RepID=UPI0037009BDB
MGRAVPPGEPEWTQEDTLLAIEWQRLQDETCQCGHLLSESLDEANEYEPKRITCFACQAKERAERAASEREGADLSGHKITVTLVGRRPVVGD